MREGYRLAEAMLRDYRDPPSLFETIGNGLSACREMALGLYRAVMHDEPVPRKSRARR